MCKGGDEGSDVRLILKDRRDAEDVVSDAIERVYNLLRNAIQNLRKKFSIG